MALVFVISSVGPVHAQSAAVLPAPGSMVALSQPFTPAVLKGIKVYLNDPFRFDFILDQGDRHPEAQRHSDPRRGEESQNSDVKRLIKYFLASLTVPEKDLWVNLSPYEKGRIVPEAFGRTEMGRDLLAQDYLLKQITASVIYPEGATGKKFWEQVYAKVYASYGTTDIPVDTFNKIWILPDKVSVYENIDKAFVVKSRLKVMLETDYLAQSVIPSEVVILRPPLGAEGSQSSAIPPAVGRRNDDDIAKQIMRQIVIPILEKEVNEGANFAPLRQVYNSLILATWYKKKVRESLLSSVYVNKKKVSGVNIDDPKETEKIWAQYVEAFKKGAFNYIKEETDPLTQELVPRKYFSGGVVLDVQYESVDAAELPASTGSRFSVITSDLAIASVDPSQGVSLDDRSGFISTKRPVSVKDLRIGLFQGTKMLRGQVGPYVIRHLLKEGAADARKKTRIFQKRGSEFFRLMGGAGTDPDLRDWLYLMTRRIVEPSNFGNKVRQAKFWVDANAGKKGLVPPSLRTEVVISAQRPFEMPWGDDWNMGDYFGAQIQADFFNNGYDEVSPVLEEIRWQGTWYKAAQAPAVALERFRKVQAFADKAINLVLFGVAEKPGSGEWKDLPVSADISDEVGKKIIHEIAADYEQLKRDVGENDAAQDGRQSFLQKIGVLLRNFTSSVRDDPVKANVFEQVDVTGWRMKEGGQGTVYIKGGVAVKIFDKAIPVPSRAHMERFLSLGRELRAALGIRVVRMYEIVNVRVNGKFVGWGIREDFVDGLSADVSGIPYDKEAASILNIIDWITGGLSDRHTDDEEASLGNFIAPDSVGINVVNIDPVNIDFLTSRMETEADDLAGTLDAYARIYRKVRSDERAARATHFSAWVEGLMVRMVIHLIAQNRPLFLGGQPDEQISQQIEALFKKRLETVGVVLADDSPEMQAAAQEIGIRVQRFSAGRRALADLAQAADGAQKGGIDLNPAAMDMQMQSSGGEIKFNIDPAQMEQLRNAPGFEPVIINIQPMTDLNLFLGLKNQDRLQMSSRT